ncbi:MAG: tetratricopeptide repeat protein [Armatimonadota bacterium]
MAEGLAAGAALEAQERYDEALAEYRKAADADQEAAEPHWAMAQVYRRQKRAVEALSELQRYLTLAPDGPHADTARQQMEALRQPAKPDPLAPLVGRQLRSSPSPPRATARNEWVEGQWNLALRWEAMGEYDGARKAFGLILTREPNFVGRAPLYEHMAYCSLGLDPPEYDRAAHYLEQAAKEYQRLGSTADADRCLDLAAQQRAQVRAESEEAPPATGAEEAVPESVPPAVIEEEPA